MHETGEAHAVPPGPAQLHRLKALIQRGDAEGFANELNLDPNETRQWFEHSFTADGYGVKVIQAIGTSVLYGILVTSGRDGCAHG